MYSQSRTLRSNAVTGTTVAEEQFSSGMLYHVAKPEASPRDRVVVKLVVPGAARGRIAATRGQRRCPTAMIGLEPEALFSKAPLMPDPMFCSISGPDPLFRKSWEPPFGAKAWRLPRNGEYNDEMTG